MRDVCLQDVVEDLVVREGRIQDVPVRNDCERNVGVRDVLERNVYNQGVRFLSV